MGGRLIETGQHDHHVFMWRMMLTLKADSIAYRMLRTCNYGQDVGNLHVIDYRLWLAELPIRRPGCEAPSALYFTDNWTRP